MAERCGIFERGEAVEHALRELYTAYGYRPYRMSKFEPYDLYLRHRSFVAGGRILTFTDADGRLMALKPDVTLSVIRNYRGGQHKVFYHENVYRDTGSSHEFREIPQAGLECIGDIDLYTQLEVLTLAAESLRRISDAAILDIASVAYLKGLLAAAGTEEDGSALLAFLREKNVHGLCRFCEEKAFPSATAAVWQELALLCGPAGELLRKLESMSLNEEMRSAARELIALTDRMAVQEGVRLNLDFSILRDLNYYNGLVFRGFVPGLSAGILSGGRYDNLVRELGKQAGAVGFAVYLDLLSQLPAGERGPDADVLLLYGEGDTPEEVMARAAALRATGLTVRVQRQEEGRHYGRVLRMGGEEP